MKHNVASILIGVAIIGSSAGAQNLILNGSFESPSVPPNVVSSTAPTSWLAGGGFVAIIRGDYSPGYPLAQDGQQYATVGNSSSLSQAFTIDSPGTYELSWFDSTEFNGPDQHSPYSVSVTDSMSNIVASADFDANATALRVWAPRSIQFTLVAKTYTLRFDGHAGVFAERSLIDNISLQANVPGWRIFPVATNPVPEVSLSAAFDGVNYLLAIQGGLVDHDEVTYQLFSKTGTLIGSKTSTGHFGSIPHVAFDGNRYLMVWQDVTNSSRNVWGQFISRAGALTGNAFQITSGPGTQNLDMSPIAFGGKKYLIVYRDDRSGTNALYGQLVTSLGALFGAEITIDADGLAAQEGGVAFDGSNFLVAWQKRTGDSHYETYGAFISQSGLKAAPFVISQSASLNHNPLNLLFNGTNYLVVWNKDAPSTSGSAFDIYARFVSPAGSFPEDEVALVTAPGSQVLPGLAFDGANYLLSWSDGPFAGANNVLKFRFFSPALQPIGSELTPFPARGTNYPFATLALFDGTQFAAIGTLANVDATFHFLSGDIYGTFIPKLDVSILVNGIASSGSVLVTNQAAVDITTTISNGVIFYTLDGAYPGIGPFYTGTLFLTQSATIRALAYAPDYSFSVEGLTVNMTVVSTPTVGVQPLAEDRLVGGTAMFTAQATGTPPLSYQWSFNGSLIPGAVNSSLLISNVQLSQAGQYSVRVSNTFGTISTTPAVLNVYDLPAIVTQPAGTNVFTNSPVTFKVVATGVPAPHYQWRLNGVNLSDETNSTLTILTVQIANGGSYTVVVANDLGTVITEPAQLTIQVPAAQPGDFFTNRVLIAGMSGIVSGTNSLASKEPGEPNPAQKPGGKSVWYRWVSPITGIATFSTRGSTFDTLLGAYRGSIVTNLVVQASDEDSGGGLTSQIRFNVTDGQEYEIAIDGYAGASGYFLLSWSVEMTAQTVPTISQQPQSLAVLPGSNALFSVTASGAALIYHWFFNDVTIPGADGASLLVANAQIKHIGSYTVQISNSFGRKITSNPASLELISQPSSPTADKLADADASAPTNQFFGPTKGPPSFTPVGFGTVGYQFFGNTHSSTDPIDPAHCAIGGASRWLKFVANIDGLMSIDTITSQVYTVVAVYRGGNPADITPANLIACDVNSAPDGHSLVRFQAQHGVTNSVLIDGTNGATGLIFLHYCLGAAPVVGSEIPMPPAREGGPLSLAASVSGGTPPPTYQWYRNSQPISLATGPSYFVSEVQAQDAGVYSLVVSNCLGLSSNVVSRITVDIPLTLGFTTSRVSGQFQFHVTASLMHDVTVEGTTNFLNWIPLWTNHPPALLDYLDPLSATLPWRFYRAIPWP